LLIVGCFVLGGTIASSVLYVRHVFETTVVRAASAAGIRLNLGRVTYGVGFVQIFDSRFDIINVPGLSGQIKRVDLDWTGFSPTKLLLSKVTIYAKGDPIKLYEAASAYSEQLRRLKFDSVEQSKPIPFELAHLDVEGTFENILVSSVAMTEVKLKEKVGHTNDQTVISAQSLRINQTDYGPFTLAYRLTRGHVELGAGSTLEQSDFRLAYHPGDALSSVDITLKSLETKVLFERFALGKAPEDLSHAKLAGTFHAELSTQTGKITAKTALQLTGFLPPHPNELKGYAFKDESLFIATLQSDPLYSTIDIPIIQLSNGDLKLVGVGRMERMARGAKIIADLSAILDCVTLAKGFAKDDIGGALGQWGQRNAKKAVRGSVDVRIQLDADTTQWNDAKVVKRIGFGCGLRPLSLVDLLTLELPPPPDAKTAERLGKLVTNPGQLLPQLPTFLPSLDELLDVNIKRK
jgi:hypothetical protein